MITPLPGWKIDPNNPNGVVKDDSYIPQASSPTTTYTRDPATGSFSSQGAPGMSPVATNPLNAGGFQLPMNPGANMTPGTPAQNGSAPTPGSSDPYTAFNQQLMEILKSAQGTGSNAPLYAAKDELNNEALNLSNPLASTPYSQLFKGMAPNAVAPAMAGTQAAFSPGITSINSQIQSNNDANTKFNEMANTAENIAGNFKPIVTAPGQSLVSPTSGQTVSQGHSYTAQINPMTGLLDGFDQNTGTWASQDHTGGSGTAPVTGGVPSVEAIFGKSNPIGAYATDPNYVQEISGLYKKVSALGVVQNTEMLDQYIKNNAGNAPVTGQMILHAAETYGVDPALLTSVLLHESDFGTAGAAVKTMNPGNQGNTGTSTQSYNSWTQGVMATASNLANRIKASIGTLGQGNASASPATSTLGGNFNSVYSQKVSQMPQSMQNYVDSGPAGVAYINDDRVPSTVKSTVQTMASRAGIPYLATADVASMQSLATAQQNMDLMQSAATETLGQGFWGGIMDIGATYGNNATFGNAFPSFSQFNGYASAAIAALKGLAGSGGGFRITQNEIDTAQANMPQSTDTLAHAQKKMQILQGLINTTIAKTFPDAPINITLPDGSQATVPAQNYSAAVKLGAIPK